MTTPRPDRKRKGSPEWIRLGELLADRRADLSPDYEGHGGRAAFARDRAVNLKLIQDIELNARENFTPKTLRDDIARAYEVTYESVRAALEGGSLVPATYAEALPPLPDLPPGEFEGFDGEPVPFEPMDEGEFAAMAAEYEFVRARYEVALAAEQDKAAVEGRPPRMPSGRLIFPGDPRTAQSWDFLLARGYRPATVARSVAELRAEGRRRAGRGDGTRGALLHPARPVLVLPHGA